VEWLRAASASIAWPKRRIGRGESRENSERREQRERRERGGQGLPVPVPEAVPLVQMHPHNQGTVLTPNLNRFFLNIWLVLVMFTDP